MDANPVVVLAPVVDETPGPVQGDEFTAFCWVGVDTYGGFQISYPTQARIELWQKQSQCVKAKAERIANAVALAVAASPYPSAGFITGIANRIRPAIAEELAKGE